MLTKEPGLQRLQQCTVNRVGAEMRRVGDAGWRRLVVREANELLLMLPVVSDNPLERKEVALRMRRLVDNADKAKVLSHAPDMRSGTLLDQLAIWVAAPDQPQSKGLAHELRCNSVVVALAAQDGRPTEELRANITWCKMLLGQPEVCNALAKKTGHMPTILERLNEAIRGID